MGNVQSIQKTRHQAERRCYHTPCHRRGDRGTEQAGFLSCPEQDDKLFALDTTFEYAANNILGAFLNVWSSLVGRSWVDGESFLPSQLEGLQFPRKSANVYPLLAIKWRVNRPLVGPCTSQAKQRQHGTATFPITPQGTRLCRRYKSGPWHGGGQRQTAQAA